MLDTYHEPTRRTGRRTTGGSQCLVAFNTSPGRATSVLLLERCGSSDRWILHSFLVSARLEEGMNGARAWNFIKNLTRCSESLGRIVWMLNILSVLNRQRRLCLVGKP